MDTSALRDPCGSRRVLIVALLVALVMAPGRRSWALSPESPEVKSLINQGLNRLQQITDTRLGGACVVGLAFVKAEQTDHPRVTQAVSVCRRVLAANEEFDVYSNGLAIIFLCELNARKYRSEIQQYLNALHSRQKPHGGWGYDARSTGDTSQTQYAALAYWEANRYGFDLDAGSLAGLADWLIRCQGPDGSWGYQGVVSTTSQPVAQSRVTVCMVAAGLGSALICADLLGAIPDFGSEDPGAAELPPALANLGGGRPADAPRFDDVEVDRARLTETIQRGKGWFDENYTINHPAYANYYLYALERYKSFEELYEGIPESDEQWYEEGFELLKSTQRETKGWDAGCDEAVDTAFAVLFLMRSTQKTIRASLGEGTLTAGRGLPKNVAQATMRGGQIIVEQTVTQVDEMLRLIDEDQAAGLEDLARNPTFLAVGEVDEQSARRLEQLVRAGQPEVRLLAVRALARTGELDYVPTLLYAMTDPDKMIVREARDGLRFISRRFDGYGLPDNFSEKQRYEALDKWKQWYKRLRPEANLDL